jgi:hypothetical protein
LARGGLRAGALAALDLRLRLVALGVAFGQARSPAVPKGLELIRVIDHSLRTEREARCPQLTDQLAASSTPIASIRRVPHRGLR